MPIILGFLGKTAIIDKIFTDSALQADWDFLTMTDANGIRARCRLKRKVLKWFLTKREGENYDTQNNKNERKNKASDDYVEDVNDNYVERNDEDKVKDPGHDYVEDVDDNYVEHNDEDDRDKDDRAKGDKNKDETENEVDETHEVHNDEKSEEDAEK